MEQGQVVAGDGVCCSVVTACNMLCSEGEMVHSSIKNKATKKMHDGWVG
jgi:hypothetical protein